MPHKSKNQVIEIEDSDVESVASAESHTDDSDCESVVSSVSSDEIETKPVKKASKTSKTKSAKGKTTKTKAKKGKAESKTKTKSAKSKDVEDDEPSNVEKAFEMYNEKIKTLAAIEEQITNLLEQVKTLSKEFKSCCRSLKKGNNEVQATVAKDIKKLEKQKRKTSGDRKQGGFTKAKPVPIKLCKFLGIPVDSELPRAKVTQKCYQEFKSRDMSIGDRKYEFDKESAKVFGADEGDEFHIHSFQGLLAKVYNESSTKEDL